MVSLKIPSKFKGLCMKINKINKLHETNESEINIHQFTSNYVEKSNVFYKWKLARATTIYIIYYIISLDGCPL